MPPATLRGLAPPAPAGARHRRSRCTCWPRSPAWPRRGCSASLVEAVHDGHHRRPRRQDRSGADRGFLLAQTVLTRYARLRVVQRSASRCWPSCARTSSSNRSRCRSARSRAAGTGDLLTRTSRDVEQLGWSVRWALPGVADRAGHRRAHADRRGSWSAGGCCCRCLLGVPPAGDRAALVPRAAPRPATCARARRTRRSTPRSPRPSRAPGRSRRSASSRPRIDAGRRRHRRVVRAPSGTRCACGRSASRRSRSPT